MIDYLYLVIEFSRSVLAKVRTLRHDMYHRHLFYCYRPKYKFKKLSFLRSFNFLAAL